MRTYLEDLFHAVADLDRDARVRHFTEHGIDATAQREVEALLEFDSSSNTTLERNLGHLAWQALARFEPKGMRCGPYRLGNLLGRGGMGSVYLAERVDGEVTQRVAVKLLRPGADDPSLRQRFLAERQILAALSHPHIARLLDAGHREDGQPYLVMEYVEGTAIDAYTSALGLREKITLFLKVCAAVGYLHRNLVVHRDLKPANILVTGEGEPKLLDFGIARMLDWTTDSTMTAMRILTPDYASPEQVTGGPVSTAIDIYSLGAVLYRLLTSVSPNRLEGGTPESMALAISLGRITPPSQLAPALKGDLEAILMKALRREPQERYATVEQFCEDLESFLQSRPVRARKGDTWYRALKFLRRHWLPVAASGLAVAGLTGGVLVANQQRAVAQQRFLEVRQLANKLFDIDVEARKLAGSTKTRQLIVNTSLEYLRRLSADVREDPELALEVGHAYLRVARVQGVPISANLGQMDQAEQNLRIADRLIHSVLLAQPSNRTAMLRAAQAAHDRMLLARFKGRNEEALELARQSAKWLERFPVNARDRLEVETLLATYMNVAQQYKMAEHFDDALRLSQRGSQIAQSIGSNPYRGMFCWVSAGVLQRRGSLDEALRTIQEATLLLEPGPGQTEQGRTMNYVLVLTAEGRILNDDRGISLGRPEEALKPLSHAFEVADRAVHQDFQDQSSRGRLAEAGLAWADALRHSDPRRAVAVYDHVLDHLAEIPNNVSFRRYEVSALVRSIDPLRHLDRPAEIRRRLDTAFERLRQLKAYPAEVVQPGSEPDEALRALADEEASRGAVLRAIGIDEELLRKTWASKPEPATSLIDAMDMSRLYAALAALHR